MREGFCCASASVFDTVSWSRDKSGPTHASSIPSSVIQLIYASRIKRSTKEMQTTILASAATAGAAAAAFALGRRALLFHPGKEHPVEVVEVLDRTTPPLLNKDCGRRCTAPVVRASLRRHTLAVIGSSWQSTQYFHVAGATARRGCHLPHRLRGWIRRLVLLSYTDSTSTSDMLRDALHLHLEADLQRARPSYRWCHRRGRSATMSWRTTSRRCAATVDSASVGTARQSGVPGLSGVYGGKLHGERVVLNGSSTFPSTTLRSMPRKFRIASAQRHSGNWIKLDPTPRASSTPAFTTGVRRAAAPRYHEDLGTDSPTAAAQRRPSGNGVAAPVETFIRETPNITPLCSGLPPTWVGPPLPWYPAQPGLGEHLQTSTCLASSSSRGTRWMYYGAVAACTYWGLQVWNRYMHRSTIRDHCVVEPHQVALEGDGTFRVVLAHRDPGVSNWIDTAGHREGIVFCRGSKPTAHPSNHTPTVADLGTLKPA